MNPSRAHMITAVLTFTLLPVACFAATRNVQVLDDCNDTTGTPSYCQISAALEAAADGDVIEIAEGVFAEELVITKSVTLHGAGANATVLDGSSAFRPVSVTGGIVVISDLTVQFGDAIQGGGIYLGTGCTLNLTNVSVYENHAVEMGGGIYSAGSLTVTSSRIVGNRSGTRGGGVAIMNGTTDVISSTIAHNGAGLGGGAYGEPGSRLDIENSTISNNVSIGLGGALYNAGVVTLINATVAENLSVTPVGGVYNSGTASLHNTLLAGNTGPYGEQDCGTSDGVSIVSGGHNFIGALSDCSITISNGDLFDRGFAASNLGELATSGGNTPTRALLPGSAAIDAGADCLDLDQRGVARPLDGDGDGTATCDIGAYEAPAATPGGGGGGGGGVSDWLALLMLGFGACTRRLLPGNNRGQTTTSRKGAEKNKDTHNPLDSLMARS